jgi:acyl-CoA synthetase (AMP-forming)/AMP-acid ligase II
MAGAPVPPALMARMQAVIPNGEIHTPYGATEALPVSSISASEVLRETAQQTRVGEGTCVGKALPGVEVRVIEPVDGVVASVQHIKLRNVGEVGELIVKGPSVTKGYDNRSEADAKSKIMDAEGHWHRMGDLGKLDAQGRLWFCGRMVERVLSEDGPLYTDCCEAVFNQHAKVYRSALIDTGGGRPAIVIEPEPGHFPKGQAAKEGFRAELMQLAQANPTTKGIERFHFEKSFPVDIRHNAKIHRLSLAERYR